MTPIPALLLIVLLSVARVSWAYQCVEDYDKEPKVKSDCDFCIAVEAQNSTPSNYRLCGLANKESLENLLQQLLDSLKKMEVNAMMESSRRVLNRLCDVKCRDKSSCVIEAAVPTPTKTTCCKGDLCSGQAAPI